jgi:hypothetical protein
VGESIYYVDSSGSSLGGVVTRVTSEGAQVLDFTAGEDMASVTFAVSDDESRIAWTHSTFGAEGVTSRLWIADIDGSDIRLAVESDPNDDIAEYYALETVRWMPDGDLVYAWQVTGIGGYILFFGWSSLFRYDPVADTTTPLIPLEGEGAGPCWYAISPDGMYALGGCGSEGLLERNLVEGSETAFPVLPGQGQQGAGAYSPSGDRLAYAIARGNPEDELGQVLVRLSQDEEAIVLSTQSPGYFGRILWADEDRLVVGAAQNDRSSVDVLTVDGTRSAIGEGELIGLLRGASPASDAGDDLKRRVDRGDLVIRDLTGNGEIAGPGIDLVVHNPRPRDIVTTIPCGFIFEPTDGGDQRLMVVQPASVTVAAGGETSLSVYVVCIDSHQDTPDEGAGYSLGGMQSGPLLQLAQCACQQDLAGSLNPFEGMGVMTAGWMISEGKLFSEMVPEDAAGAMGELFGPDSEQSIAGLMGLLEQPAMAWFDRCGIPKP